MTRPKFISNILTKYFKLLMGFTYAWTLLKISDIYGEAIFELYQFSISLLSLKNTNLVWRHWSPEGLLFNPDCLPS